jgi:hypothetical protein
MLIENSIQNTNEWHASFGCGVIRHDLVLFEGKKILKIFNNLNQ